MTGFNAGSDASKGNSIVDSTEAIGLTKIALLLFESKYFHR